LVVKEEGQIFKVGRGARRSVGGCLCNADVYKKIYSERVDVGGWWGRRVKVGGRGELLVLYGWGLVGGDNKKTSTEWGKGGGREFVVGKGSVVGGGGGGGKQA